MENIIAAISNSRLQQPELHFVKWDDRSEIKGFYKSLTASKQKLMSERVDFFESKHSVGAQEIIVLILCPHATFICAVVKNQRDQLVVLSFAGGKKKANSYFCFRDLGDVAYETSRLKLTQDHHKPTTVSAEIGDVYYSIWGYEQSNASFFSVVKTTAKTITLQPIESLTVEEDMIGKAAPLPGKFKGEPITKKVQADGSVRIECYMSAQPCPYEMVAGTKIYKSFSTTSYS